jgi:RNA polymerase sigma-70 factor, ECF subfamily
MKLGDTLALSRLNWEGEFLEDTSLRRIVVDYYDREHLSLRRYFVFLGLNADSAEEIVQESFLRLHQHLMGGGDKTNLRAWLYRVGHNLARNEQAAYRTKKLEPLDDAIAGNEPSTSSASPEEELLAGEQLARLRRTLLMLNDSQRQCLVLRAQGFKYREIAGVLNLSISTVGEHVQRGLEKLKELL